MSFPFHVDIQIPYEIKVEVTYRCNHHCYFCFNNSQNLKEMSTRDFRNVTYQVASYGVKRIRFTGGEPFIRKDMMQVMEYAKSLGLYVMLNSNGTLISDLDGLKQNTDDLLISLNSFDESTMYKITSDRSAFQKKIELIKSIAGPEINLRVSTVAIKENIRSLEKFYDLISKLPVDQWLMLRPMPNPENTSPLSKQDVRLLVDKMIALNKKYGMDVKIENAIPFCAYDPDKVSTVAIGAICDDGHSKMVVDASGNIKPSYFIDKILGNIFEHSFRDCWNNEFMVKMRNLKFVPGFCSKCKYLEICRGGSYHASKFAKDMSY